MSKAALRLLAASTPAFNADDLPSNVAQYASEHNDGLLGDDENLYDYTSDVHDGAMVHALSKPPKGGYKAWQMQQQMKKKQQQLKDSGYYNSKGWGGGGDPPKKPGGGSSGFYAPPKGVPESKTVHVPTPSKQRTDAEYQRLVKVLSYFDNNLPALKRQIEQWFSGAVGSKAGWAGDMKNHVARTKFITGMASIGRMFPTPVPKVAYRACSLHNPKAGVIGFKGKLGIGSRGLLSFAQDVQTARRFAESNRATKQTVIIKTDVTPQNYVCTFQALEAFATTGEDCAERLTEDGVLGKKLSARDIFYGFEDIGSTIREYNEEREIILSFKDADHVQVTVCGVAERDPDDGYGGWEYNKVVADSTAANPVAHSGTGFDHDFVLEAAKGGIGDTWGDPSMDLLDGTLSGSGGAQPNAQKSLNGSVLQAALRVLSDRLSTESDPLTRDQENYGSGSHLKEAGLEELELLDPDTCSTYSRENNSNGNHYNKLGSSATTDDPQNEVGDGLNARGQEGMNVFGADTADGDFDAHGYRGGDRIITQDPDTSGYLHVHSALMQVVAARKKRKKPKSKGHPRSTKKHKSTKHKYPDDLDDPTWGYIADAQLAPEVPTTGDPDFGEEVLSDADPSLFNMANQPLGQAG